MFREVEHLLGVIAVKVERESCAVQLEIALLLIAELKLLKCCYTRHLSSSSADGASVEFRLKYLLENFSYFSRP